MKKTTLIQKSEYQKRESIVFLVLFFSFLFLNMLASFQYPEEEHISVMSSVLLLLPHQLDYRNELARLTPKDRLTAETLPAGQLEADLAKMREIGGDHLDAVYLVRKTVGEHFRSQYVVKLDAGTSEAEINRIMNGIFNYLDTVSDWDYGLFFYEGVKNIRFRKIPGCCVYEKGK